MIAGDAPRGPRLGGPAVVATAVVVAIVALSVGIGLRSRGGSAGPEPASPTAAPTASPARSSPSPEVVVQSVPWLSGPVAEQPPPPPSWPGFPDSPPCSAPAVRATIAPRRNDGLRTSYLLTLRNTGTEVCALQGFAPAVRAVRADGSDAVVADNAPHDRLPYLGGDIAPGQYGHLVVETATNCRDPQPGARYPRVVLTMPGGGTVEVTGSFDLQCGLRAGQFGYPPEFWPPAPTRYADVTAAISAPPTATAGRPLRYHVTLTSSRDFALDPCPSYRQSARGQTLVREFHLLNCGAVVRLRAGVPVRFEMVIPMPDEPGGRVELEWRLQHERPTTAVVHLIAP